MEMNNPMKRTILGFILSASLLLGSMPGVGLTAYAQEASASGDIHQDTPGDAGTADGNTGLISHKEKTLFTAEIVEADMSHAVMSENSCQDCVQFVQECPCVFGIHAGPDK